MILSVKYQKSAMFGLGEFFYLNKLRPDFFSWNISVFKVYECGKLYFFAFIYHKILHDYSYLSNILSSSGTLKI